MTHDRASGVALIASSLAGIITMSFHPTGPALFAPGQFASVARLVVATHALALFSLPVVFLGALGLSQRLSTADWCVPAALVTYAFALVAFMNAGVMSGLVNIAVGEHLHAAPQGTGDGWRILFNYTGQLNQAFAKVSTMASSAAIVLWSAAILRSRALPRGIGVYGFIVGPVIMTALLSGHLRLDVHGFGLVVLLQALWFVAVGASLWRAGGNDLRATVSGSAALKD
jgi:hypothetical protein